MVESTYTIGVKKGRKEGRQERDFEIASKLILAGLLDFESISEVTGLSLETVKALKDEIVDD